MQTRMKPHLFYTFLTIFAATAVVTLLALTGVVTVVGGYLGWLVSAFLVESAGAVIALFRGAKFFEEASVRHAPHSLNTSAADENESPTLRLPTLKGRWMLCFIGQKQSEILYAVFKGLRKPFSATGDGKEFSSGLAYWGIIPTWNWMAACHDPKYPVMERGLKHFERVLPDILTHLGKPFHYASLGVGDGRVDSRLVGALPIPPRALYYFPVDFSPEMLRMGIEPVRAFAKPGRREVVPIQLDFAEREYVGELRKMVEQFVNSDPVLFGLVGNTLANFEDDSQILKTLPSLLRPQDRLLLGVSFTDELSEELAARAAGEYRHSQPFARFLTSAVLQNTDISLDQGSLHFEGTVEPEKALFVKMFFRNKAGKNLRFRLPEGESVQFPKDDTIRLYVSRKYLRQALCTMLKKADLEVVWSDYYTYDTVSGFGSAIMLVKKAK
jgi:L-histidine Nalpha-methyltransferase